MLKSFKTEIDPSLEQMIKINKTLGVCRYIYNFYLDYSKNLYDHEKKFITGKDFSVWLNNYYLPNNPDKLWIKEVNSKAVKKSIENGYVAFRRFFKHQSEYPRYKEKHKSNNTMYFVKNNANDCLCERHRIKIPSLGWVKLKEKGYIPITKNGNDIISGTISKRAGRYYVSVLIRLPDLSPPLATGEGIGVDLGVKEFAVVSNRTIYKNINKGDRIKKIEK